MFIALKGTFFVFFYSVIPRFDVHLEVTNCRKLKWSSQIPTLINSLASKFDYLCVTVYSCCFFPSTVKVKQTANDYVKVNLWSHFCGSTRRCEVNRISYIIWWRRSTRYASDLIMSQNGTLLMLLQNFVLWTIEVVKIAQNTQQDHWSCIAHLSAEVILKSAVIEEKKFKHSPWAGTDNPLGPNFGCQQEGHYGHFCSFDKNVFNLDFIHIFSWFNKCIQPQVRGRQPQGTTFWCQQKPLVTSVIRYKFQKNLFEVWFYTFLSWFYTCI